MSKGYIKDANGKYMLVEKDAQGNPIIMVNTQRPSSLEEIDKRLRKVESFLFLAGKK
jgi:hypothetical protein